MSNKDNELFKSGLEMEVSNKTPETLPPPPPTPHRRRRRVSRTAAPIGLTVLLLCAIGIITVIGLIVSVTKSIVNNDKEKARFQHFLLPVVMYDPPPFENATNLDQAALLQTAMWSAILNNDDEKWAKDELNFSLIPASELDVRAASLFGPSVKLEHQTFGDYETTYVYDAENKLYSVPPTAEIALYTPDVQKITKNGDELILRVGYIPPGSLWEIDEKGNRFEPDPEKTMNYIMKKTGSGYIITALRDVEDNTSSAFIDISSLEEDLITKETSSIEGETFGDESEAAMEESGSAGDGAVQGETSSATEESDTSSEAD